MIKLSPESRGGEEAKAALTRMGLRAEAEADAGSRRERERGSTGSRFAAEAVRPLPLLFRSLRKLQAGGTPAEGRWHTSRYGRQRIRQAALAW